MTSRKVLILAAIAVAVLAAALLLSHRETATQQQTAAVLYPDLKGQLNKVTAVRIFRAGDAQAVELVRKDADWTVAERSGYPANAPRVHKLLLALAEAKPLEEKTSNPQSYATLGVEDVSGAAATGARIEIVGPSATVNLIVGKSAAGSGAYVRRAGEAASWLIDQGIDAPLTPSEWLRTSIVDVSADRVQSAAVTTEGARPYVAEKTSRADADFKVDAAVPKGKELDQFAANAFANVLTGLTLSDVHPAADFATDKPAAHATVRTFDGLIVDLDGWTREGKHYIAVKTAYDDALAQRFHVETKAPEKPAEAKPEGAPAEPPAPVPAAANEKVDETAKTLNAQLQGWVYEVSDYKYEAIFKPA
ncbi:MAG TPA: DUF4340 domain-containing protein, partial [Povalibacter sp.]|nr:DUF4340 domain-containing protein [Povalibacter sp.]